MLHGTDERAQGGAASGGAPAARLRPLDDFAGSLSARAYAALKEAILTLAYRPGEILRKAEICEALGVSRSPVADAVARLAAEGLVDVVPQAGTFVARFSMEEIREGAFLREAVELAAIEHLAPRVTEDQLVEIRRNLRIQEALIADGDVAGFYRLDAAPHETLLAFTGFRRLVQVSQTAQVHVTRARRLVLPVPGRVAATLGEHRAILEALEARDADAARRAMRTHLRQLITYLEPLERERPDLFDPS
jgi:DNA-binding GntR family transcriptional regulator